MSLARFTAFLEACTGEPSTPEQVVDVARDLYALVPSPNPDATDDHKAAAGLALARLYLQSAVRSGAEAREAARQERASIEAIRAAGDAAARNV